MPFSDAPVAAPDALPNAPDLSPYAGQPQTMAPYSPTSPVLSPTGSQAFGQAVAYGLPGIGVGLLDTMGQSIGVFHNDTVPNVMKSVFGDQEGSLGDFYSRNQPILRAGGEVAGMFLPGMAALKVLKTVKMAREAGTFGEAAMNSGALDVLLGNSADLTAKENAIANAVTEGQEVQGVWAGKSVALPAVNAAKRSYYAARAVDAARTTVAFELGNRVAFNSSSTFYPPDYTLTDQLKWTAAGLAGGIGIDVIMAKYAVRNLVQSAIKGYADTAPADAKAATVAAIPLAKDVDKTIFRPGERGVGITQFAGLSSDLEDTAKVNGNPQFKTNIAQDQTNIKAVMSKQINALAYDTHPLDVLPRTQLSGDQVDLTLTALKQNNTALLFAKKLGNVPADMNDFYDGIKTQLDGAQKDFDTAKILSTMQANPTDADKIIADAYAVFRTIQEAANEAHYVLENSGDYTVFKNRAPNWLDQNGFDDIRRKTYTTPNPNAPTGPLMKNSQLLLKGDNDIAVHDNFRVQVPAGATPMDFSAVYAAGSKLIQDWKPVEGQQFILTPDLNWRTTEGTLALADKYPAAKQAVVLGGDFHTMEDAQFHVLNEKFKEFQDLMPNTAAPATGVRARIASTNYTPAQVIQRLNLPETSGLQANPVVEMFAHAKLQGMDDLYDMFPMKNNTLTPATYTRMDMVQQHLRETAGIADQSVKMPIQGTLLNQQDVKPVFVSATSTPMAARSDSMIAARVQADRDVQLQKLAQISPQDSPVVSGVIGKIVTQAGDSGELSGAANQARAVQTLHDGVTTGTGQFVYQDRINEQFPTLKSAQLIAQDTDTWTKNYVATLAQQSGLTDKLGQILAPKNKADLFDFNRIEQAYRHGWEINGFEPDPTGSGGMVATLKTESKINPSLVVAHFPDQEVDEGMNAYMPDMSVTSLKTGYQPLVVSKNAADLATTISTLSKQSGSENNTLRAALGSNPIKIRDFHLPTPELSKKETWFVRNDAGKVVATYSSSNVKANQTAAQEAADVLNKSDAVPGSNHVAVPLDMVQRDHLINDDNFFDLIDYSDQLAKTGAGITGGLAHTKIDSTDTTLKAMVNSLQRQYTNIGIRARAAVFEPELNYAKQASVAAGATSRENLGRMNIFDRYISTMFSQNPINNYVGGQPGSPIQAMYNTTETGMDRALSWLSAHVTELKGSDQAKAIAGTARALLRKESSPSEFAGFAKTMPSWSPLKDANDWAESTFKESKAWTTKPIMQKLASTSTTLALRFLDVGMAVTNLANLATNMPSVVTALRRLPSETTEQWINRTAAWGSQHATGVMTFSPLKAMSNASKSFWAGELTQPMLDAAKHGYFEPEWASLAKTLTTPQKGKLGSYLDTFSEAATKLTDKSEFLSRKLAWGMGYKIGKELHGFTDEKNSYIFANNFVNEVIGNYSANNKPAIYSGTIGQPLGAYQTYMTNFFRRLYGYVETGNKAALISQYAAQAAVFGGKSVPGYALWNKAFQSNDSGSSDFTTRINSNLPAGLGELVLNGSLSNIPKIWGGLQGDGFNWYTRGSADITELPYQDIADWTRAPPFQFLAETAKGVNATINNVFSNEGFSLQRQEEIMANFTTNRALARIMEMAADVKTDKRGQVIVQGTRNEMQLAASLLGAQPESTQQLQDATSREKMVQLSQENSRATLNQQTRAIFQSGKFDTGTLQGMVKDYLNSGGNPAYLGEWFRNSMATASTPAAQTTLRSLAASGKLLEFQGMLSSIQQNQDPNRNKTK